MRSGRGFGLLGTAVVVVLLVLTNAPGLPAAGPASGRAHAPAALDAAPADATPFVQHVVVVVLENEVLSNVWGHGPYERYLAAQYGNATQYYAACHPSAPNYLVMFAAVANQCGSDTWNNYTNASLNEELDRASLSWGAYAESLPTGACADPGSATSGLFATRHVPALWMSNVLANPTYCTDHVLPSGEFNQSIANGTLRNYSFYTPNLCDDGHNGCGGNTTDAQETAQADSWLDGWLSPILNHTGAYASSAEQAAVNHTAFFVTWDEGTGSNAGFAVPGITGGDNLKWCGQNGATGDAVCGGQIYTSVVSPYSRHTTFAANDSPYGLLRTVEWLFHLPPLGDPGGFDNQSGFAAMTSLFRFPPEFNVTARESGLPTNAPWWFNVTNISSTSTNATTATVPLPNGTFEFVAATSLPGWTSPTGSFRVNGTAQNVTLAFSAVKIPVSFVESGLPTGTWWFLTVNNVPQPGTNATEVVVNLTEGVQSYVATTNDSTWSSPSGSFPLFGSLREVNVSFSRITYVATVSASGLPLTSPWWLNVSGGVAQRSGIGPHLSVELANGTYPFTAQADGNVWSHAAGTLNVSGGPAFASVSFALVEFPVTFTPANLSDSAPWTIDLEGSARHQAGEVAVSFPEPNGTYTFNATGPSNAPPLTAEATVEVAGGPANVTVRFDPALSIDGFVATPADPALGGIVAIAGRITGGTGPFVVRYSGLPPGCNATAAPSLQCAPSASGTFAVTILVTDAIGATASAGTTVVVGPVPHGCGCAETPAGLWELDGGVLLAVGAGIVGVVLLVRRRRRPD